MTTLRALDLFCGAGGATKGLQRAGFHVTGVDIKPQPHYCGDVFFRGDALRMCLKGYNFIWASPPCQQWTQAAKEWRSKGREYPNLILALRKQLQNTAVSWTIENVAGAPLLAPIMLCGTMFALRIYRHRYFESNFAIIPPVHKQHTVRNCKMGRPPKLGEFIQVVGHFSNVPLAQQVMELPNLTQGELAQAIPPAYSEFIGRQVRKALLHERR